MKPYPWRYAQKIGQAVIQNLKERSNITLRLWADHCEYIVAQRFRRGHQITSFYRRIWGDHAFIEILFGIRRQVQRRLTGLLLSSVGIYAFDWNSERIQFQSVKTYFNEMDFVEKLKQETLMCNVCHKRKIIGEKFDGIEYCNCCNKNLVKSKNGWEPYLEGKNMIIWRREEKPSLYAYKVYATYKDVNANDFLHVQTDIEYRKEWDDTAIALEIIDSDPIDNARSHVIYWEMRWPRLFANRDYVYSRRHFIDRSKNLILICNKSTLHPRCPVKPEKQRVEEYWSYMVIKPHSGFKDPGLDFVLTYFDDPGLAIPSTITSWVAQKQMPEFVTKLYLATKKYADQKKHLSQDVFSSWEKFKTKSGDDRHRNIKVKKESESIETEEKRITTTTSDDTEQSQESLAEIEPKRRSWWSYFHPYYYFA